MSNAQTSYFKAVTLGHYLSELPKSTLPASVASDNGAYPFYCSSAVVKYCNTYLVDKPTVLMGTGGVASVNFGSEKFAYSTDTWAFRSNDEDELKTEFIYRAIQQKLPKIDYRAFEGSGLKHLRKKDVKKLLIRAPVNKVVTEKILTILREADQAIEKTEALIEKYQQIKAGLMHDLFTRGIGADGKLRPPREEAPELYQLTPIGWFPKTWDYSNLGSYTESWAMGPRFSAEEYSENGNVATLRTTDINAEGVIEYSTMPIAKLQLNGFINHLLKSNDFVITRSGTCGVCSVFESFKLPVLPGAFLIRFRFLASLSPQYLANYLNSNLGKPIVSRVAEGGVQKNLRGTSLYGIYLPVPKIEEQNLILERISTISRRVSLERRNKVKIQKQKSGLMHDLLTGKVQVSIQNVKLAHV